MNAKKFPVLLSIIGLFTAPLAQAEVNMAELKKEAIGIVKKFGGNLKPELKKAIQSGGPAHAILICSEKAPAIAEKLEKDSGWNVKRVSLKARNQNAKPDAWEKKVLQQFDKRQANGESAQKMAFAAVENGQFRFMKAQGVDDICLNCHAVEVSTDVEAALKDIYPQDAARGYSLGQIRGAFSLSKDL